MLFVLQLLLCSLYTNGAVIAEEKESVKNERDYSVDSTFKILTAYNFHTMECLYLLIIIDRVDVLRKILFPLHYVAPDFPTA